MDFKIDPALAGYIQVIWAMESESDEDNYPKSQIMPDGIVELVVHYGSPFFTYQEGVKTLQSRSFAVSMMKKYIELESNGKAGFIAARFFSWGAYHFFNEPVKNFLDQSIDCAKL